MPKFNPFYLLILPLLLVFARPSQTTLSTDVLVIGGGTAGSAAGIQSARMGVNTIIAEPTVWLGGMFSAAGVSAFDGNHNMPSGIWAEFREQLYKVYGGPSKLATGWVSNTLFEPHVGDSILKSMSSKEKNLSVHYQLQFKKAIVEGKQVKGAIFFDRKKNQTITIFAKQIIDATELGDVMASAGIPFDIGMEAGSVTGENLNIPESNNIIQDMTYAAILKDFGPAVDCTMVKPAGYDPMEFDGCCNEFCSKPEKLTSNVSARKMLDYGRLPNDKYMINWPGKGNDIYLNIISLNDDAREKELQKAKAKTLRFIYFLQAHLGFKSLALATDEFPTTDRLPLIPYHREARRLQGLVRFKVGDIADPFGQSLPLYRTGISVGDYPIDHHHRENTNAPQHLGFYPVPSFNVPLGALIPEEMNGIIIAEKSISVSNAANGTTRLQPVVMLTGQSAGALAALAVQQEKQARQVAVRVVQSALLRSGAYIMPYFDVKPSHPQFIAIQKIGATGILRGRGEPYQWANRTWFYPDSLVNTAALAKDMADFLPALKFPGPYLKISDAIGLVVQVGQNIPGKKSFDFDSRATLDEQIRQQWQAWGLINYEADRNITRAELAQLLDRTIDPFQLKGVDHRGRFN